MDQEQIQQWLAAHGTATLCTALEVMQGRVMGLYYERHRFQEFLRFLRRLDQELPGDVPLPLVVDNACTQKHPGAQARLTRHPRVIPHVVPTSSNWRHPVERWLGELTYRECGEGRSAA